MANLSPEALAKIAEALPETYEQNPDQFLTDYQALQAAKAEAERLKEVGDWYEASYKPWYQTYGGSFTEFQQWMEDRKREPEAREPEPEPTRRPGSSSTADGIDFGDPEAVRQVYDHFNTKLNETTQRLGHLDATIQTRSEELQRLLALQEQAYGLLNEATWDRIEPGWRPPVDIPKVVSYAQQNNIPDLRRAYKDYSQTDREKALEQQAYERGRKAAQEEAERAAASRTVTTEMTGGTPVRHGMPTGVQRGYGNVGREEIIARMQSRFAQRAQR
jgi:hypothetical protein